LFEEAVFLDGFLVRGSLVFGEVDGDGFSFFFKSPLVIGSVGFFGSQGCWIVSLDESPGDRSLAEPYRGRWMAELFLRDIKITMGMDVLRCKTPEMIEKEIWMRVIAYNLVRALMMRAATCNGAPVFRISIAGAIATIRHWEPVLQGIQQEKRFPQTVRILPNYIAQDLVPGRPNRSEPRALKRRKKNYQLLNKPRQEFSGNQTP
jgi:hypothetical protein